MLFRNRRERWALGRAAFEAAQEVTQKVEVAIAGTRTEVLRLRREIAEIPGASPLCPSCNGRLVMKSSKEPTGWFKLWVCQSCGFKGTLTEVPRPGLEDGD